MTAKIKYHFIGMSERDFSRKAIIYKPFKTVSSSCMRVKSENTLTEFIEKSNAEVREKLASYCIDLDFFNIENIYVEYKGYFFSFQRDMSLKEISSSLKKRHLCFRFFFAVGGASIHYMGYRFIIHPDEAIHRFDPHVHVEKNDCSPRYSLKTFKRFEKDEFLREHIRDEKKIIVPFIKKNKRWFQKEWDLNMKGFVPPVMTEDKRQIFKET